MKPSVEGIKAIEVYCDKVKAGLVKKFKEESLPAADRPFFHDVVQNLIGDIPAADPFNLSETGNTHKLKQVTSQILNSLVGDKAPRDHSLNGVRKAVGNISKSVEECVNFIWEGVELKDDVEQEQFALDTVVTSSM